jgi:hypothetical protein
LEKLERMGLKDLRTLVVFEHFWARSTSRAIQLQQRLDLRRRERPLEKSRLQSIQAKHSLPEHFLRRRLGKSLRPERRQENRRV